MSIVAGTKDRNRQVTVESAGHPAVYRKIRCQRCSVGYAVEDNVKKGVFRCLRCGAAFKSQVL